MTGSVRLSLKKLAVPRHVLTVSLVELTIGLISFCNKFIKMDSWYIKITRVTIKTNETSAMNIIKTSLILAVSVVGSNKKYMKMMVATNTIPKAPRMIHNIRC